MEKIVMDQLCADLERVARWFDGDSTECMNGAPIVRAAIEKLKTAHHQEPWPDEPTGHMAGGLRPASKTLTNNLFKQFIEWAKGEGYDVANTYDTDQSRWLCLNPMTADLWKAWKAANGIKN